jgi:hypothetical protein
MSVIAVIPATETDREVAPTASRHQGKHVPYGLAGVIVGTCTVLCPECMPEELPEDHGRIFGNEETDFPGLTCEECDRILDTALLIYESGPGSQVDLDEYDAYLLE